MQKKVLALLREAEDNYISGEEIAARLGVSRTAVWKHIRALKAAGYEIESHARRGYMLLEAPDLLLPQELQPTLRTQVIGKNMVHYGEIPSSNNEAKKLALDGAPDGTSDAFLAAKAAVWLHASAADRLVGATPPVEPNIANVAAAAASLRIDCERS